MAPPVDVLQPEPALEKTESASLAAVQPQPLHTTGLLDSLFEPDDLTPVIGRSYPTLQLRDVLRHDRSDELLRDLAIVISRRNVVTPEDQQKEFTSRLGQLSGKPRTSGLHVHPALNADREVNLDDGQRNRDNEISVVHSELFAKLGRRERPTADACIRLALAAVPVDGRLARGPGLVARVYRRGRTPRLQDQPGPPRRFGERRRGALGGAPIRADQPGDRVEEPVRQGLFPAQHRVPQAERERADPHTAQVRYRWGKNDLAVWDNRSTFHAATFDYDGLGRRSGVRAVSCGERPYFDPNSRSRRAELGN